MYTNKAYKLQNMHVHMRLNVSLTFRHDKITQHPTQYMARLLY